MKSEIEESYKDLKVAPYDSTLESSTPAVSTTLIPPTKRRLFYTFIVNKDIGYLNLISHLIASFLTICLVAYLSIVQLFVPTVLLGVNGYIGDLTGSLALYDEILALPATII
ncbi:hypothetical protein BC939DRAFT_502317 [Gamsiella multidivaricata]|uniref:uncharacterized protein n=1 Tax=Gamsiella multidivaricata TaxID=101098 RepID=UPI00222004F6|nr:uncharacterized protein BC939DRAFT_502317 [Gamsiella multidivaricata]KAI7825378.1 hypothetical protein BC939DRAFT_502317 [Gamsiella multidivaricata]